MGKNLYVGNLSYQVTEDDLKKHFEEIGACASVKIITDKESGRSKGFGFVEMDDADDAKEAIKRLNGTELCGRKLTVNAARPQQDRGGAGRPGFRRQGRF